MEPGRELDVMVGERVMGLRFDSLVMLNPPEHPWTVPHYSTDTTAAWQVLRKVCERPDVNHVSLVVTANGVAAEVCFNNRADFREVLTTFADTFPEAICNQVLVAFKDEVPTH